MRRTFCILFLAVIWLPVILSRNLYADLDDNRVIDHEMAQRIETLKEQGSRSSEDFNACQITWTTKALENPTQHSQYKPHEVTFRYENQEIIKLTNSRDGDAESIKDLGLNCLEYNDYVYLFFDTLGYETRVKFGLSDLSYIVFSSDKGVTWTELKSLDPFSSKDEFILPRDKFGKYLKIYGNSENHALSIFNLRDETTYLFDPKFKILKTVSVYNRLTSFDCPSDFFWHKNTLYLVRGSCEQIKGRLHCPSRTYMETSADFGKSWEKQTLPFTQKSYFITKNNALYRLYSTTCPSSWFGLFPAINRANRCGYIKVEELKDDGTRGKAKTLIKTVDRLFDVYKAEKPVLVWQDLRFHKSRACGYIPLVGCVDSNPFRGPTVIYAGELDVSNWQINESIISYTN